jgi:signal transduction histidine kinase
MPNEIEVLYQKPIILMFENMAVVFGLSEAKFILNGTSSNIYKRRTVVFEWTADRWLAIHLHASEPSYQISEGESWPMEALKARNEELKKLVDEKTLKLTRSIEELKTSQTKLIHSEKMASLGELTAGIAHEIQNPLNFVNNFSEVNTELIEDMEEEIDKGNFQEVKTIANDIKENQQKIAHHGKRADGIVKGMLQHSRSSTNQKEPTDINKLADEYLRLCYHGLRGKDQFFNANMQTDFDESIGKINIIPQDIGRVLLNLYTNAFYAVNEKKKSPHSLKGGMEYEPVVTVITKSLNSPLAGGDGGIEIKVNDNGNGIPQKLLDKIFQPFFTTKPTGQGTGLGLSLSYDIIKAHGGELKVETKQGEFAEFIIQLPQRI